MRLPLKSLALSTAVLSYAALAEGPRLAEAHTTLANAQQHFRTCKNGTLQLEFGATLGRLEAARKQLEKGRRETESARRKLEATRKRIEAGHQQRHESLAEGEAKEAHYQQTMETSYVTPMAALTPLVTQYVEGINAYSAVMEKYATFCAQAGVTTTSSRAFVAELAPVVETLSSSAQTFVASASSAAAGDFAARQ